MLHRPARRNDGVFPPFLWRSPPLKIKSAKIMPATAAQSWLFPKISANPFLALAEKRRFYRPKLPALRADVDRLAQKSAKPFLLPRRLRLVPPPKAACRLASSAFAVSATPPHVGATSGFGASGGYVLGCAAKAAQTADTGATAWGGLAVTGASPSRAVHTSFPCPPAGQEKRASVHLLKSPLPEMPALLRLPRPASRRPSSRP